jgi:excinuclease UvrABC nuclease subunit
LIRTFGSVKGIREASMDELVAVDGINLQLAETIKANL